MLCLDHENYTEGNGNLTVNLYFTRFIFLLLLWFFALYFPSSINFDLLSRTASEMTLKIERKKTYQWNRPTQTFPVEEQRVIWLYETGEFSAIGSVLH